MYNVFNKQDISNLMLTNGRLSTGAEMIGKIKHLTQERNNHTKAIKELDKVIKEQETMDVSVVGMYNKLKSMANLHKGDKAVLMIVNAELFDISNVKGIQVPISVPKEEPSGSLRYIIPQEVPALPFESCLVKTCQAEDRTSTFVHIMEYSPTQIVGSIIIRTGMGLAISAFTLDAETLELELKPVKEATSGSMAKYYNGMLQQIKTVAYLEISKVLSVFNTMSKHATLVDTIPKTEYINYKVGKERKKKVIKNRPIYYILDRDTYSKGTYKIDPISKLEYSYAFKVRGHWRRIQQGSLGKDRNGVYNTQGYTWVVDYIKGEGELVKRTRVAKGMIT